MKPEIFMDDFERTHFSDAIFSSIGRAITIATRFEKNCKALSIILEFKESENILLDEDQFQEFIGNIFKKRLADDINNVSKKTKTDSKILNDARKARNIVAHELTIGLDCLIDSIPKWEITNLNRQLNTLVNDIAEGDLIVSIYISKLTKEIIPNMNFLGKYKNKIINWVMDKSE